jgi:hypothetical protein
MKLRYFRHPYLDTGRDLETRRHAEAFLVGRGYRIAPVTLDAWDWMYAGVYDDAKKRGDSALQEELAKSYLSYSDQVFEYSEKLSRQIVGYEPKQILLLHANQLEADHIGELLDVMRKRGYRFITLEDALGDQAYSLPDTYVGEEGTGLDHWAIAREAAELRCSRSGSSIVQNHCGSRSHKNRRPPKRPPRENRKKLTEFSGVAYLKELFNGRRPLRGADPIPSSRVATRVPRS